MALSKCCAIGGLVLQRDHVVCPILFSSPGVDPAAFTAAVLLQRTSEFVELPVLFGGLVLLAVGGEDAGVLHAPVLHDGLEILGDGSGVDVFAAGAHDQRDLLDVLRDVEGVGAVDHGLQLGAEGEEIDG